MAFGHSALPFEPPTPDCTGRPFLCKLEFDKDVERTSDMRDTLLVLGSVSTWHPASHLEAENRLEGAFAACRFKTFFGWVAEWSKAAVLKTAVGESPPGVRISPHPLSSEVPSPAGEEGEGG